MHCLILNRLRGKILATQYHPHRFTLELFFCSMNIQQWQNLEKKNTHLFNMLHQDDELGPALVNLSLLSLVHLNYDKAFVSFRRYTSLFKNFPKQREDFLHPNLMVAITQVCQLTLPLPPNAQPFTTA